MKRTNKTLLLGILLILVVIPLSVYLARQKQEVRKKAAISSLREFGIQIDIQSPDKIPDNTHLQTLNPAITRFVKRPDKPLPTLIPTTKSLIIFNNESAPPAPIGNQDINVWRNYIDRTYLPKLRDFLDYLGKIKSSAGPAATSKVFAIEIWNEEDLCPNPAFCPRVPPRAYAYMLKKSAALIKGRDSSLRIVMGGLASGQTQYISEVRNADPVTFAQVDAVGLHPYGKSPDGWCVQGSQPGCNGNQLPFGDLAAAISEYRNAAFPLPIWITEVGYGTNNQSWQAEYLSRIFSLFIHEGVPVVIWYAWTDRMTGGENTNNWGLFDTSGRIKPSGKTFQSFTNQGDNATIQIEM